MSNQPMSMLDGWCRCTAAVMPPRSTSCSVAKIHPTRLTSTRHRLALVSAPGSMLTAQMRFHPALDQQCGRLPLPSNLTEDPLFPCGRLGRWTLGLTLIGLSQSFSHTIGITRSYNLVVTHKYIKNEVEQ